jgi:hypothetical protein
MRLRGLTVRAEIGTDWDVRLSTGENPVPPSDEIALHQALAFMAEVARTGRISGLSELSVTDARLIIDDQRIGRDIVFERMSAVFAAPGSGRAAVSGVVTRGGAAMPYRIEALTTADGARLNLSLTGVPLKLAETIGGNAALGAAGDSTVSIHGTLTVAADGRARSAAAEAFVTPGSVFIPGLFEGPWKVSEARIEAGWNAEEAGAGRFRVVYAGDGGTGAISGAIRFAADPAGTHAIEARTEALALSPLSARDAPVVVTDGSFRLRIPASGGSAFIDEAAFKGPETDLTLAGEIRRDGGGHAVTAQLAAGPMPVRAAVRWWPPAMAPAGRVWFADSVAGGVLRSLTLRLDLAPTALAAAFRNEPLPPESLSLHAVVDDATVQALEGLPPVSGLSGSGRLDARRADLEASRGLLDLGSGKRIPLSEGAVSIAGLDTSTPDLAISFRAQASAEHLAEVIRAPALREYFSVDINPQDIRGQFDGRARVAFRLGKPLGKKDIDTDIKATLRGMSLDKAIGGDKLDSANLSILADSTGVEIKGEGRWRGMPVAVSLENDTNDGSKAATLAFTIDEAQKRSLGIAGQVTGPLPVRIKALSEQGGGMRAQAEVDLTRAAIYGLLPGFQKPAGRAGKLTFEATERNKSYQIQNIALDSGAASVRGAAEIAPDGGLASARLGLFRLSPGDNVKLDFDRTPTGGRVMLRGNNFDARPFLRAASQDGPPSPRSEKDLDVDLKTTLLSGHNGEVITNAELRLQRRNGQNRQIALTGRLNGKSLKIAGQAADRPAPIAIETDDAGAFLRFMDIYTRMQGGDLAGQIRPSPRDVSGFLMARDFTLRNEPALRRLLSEAPQEGAERAADSAAFTKMRIDFSRVGSATTIREALIFGPQLGVTFNGVIDQARDRISLSGTFIPAYGLNNAFASIPVFGSLLTGGRNEGVLGITFGVSGRAAQPNVTINPLSAVAPGIFRRMFEFRNERTPAAPVIPTPMVASPN